MNLLEHTLELAQQLSKDERQHLIQYLQTWEAPLIESKAYKSAWGLCADLGPALSAEAIDQFREEIWGDFLREDIV